MTKDANSTRQSADPLHPIAVVAERTGLSRDVLRVWERRYAAVEPARSAGRQRLYTDADVRRFQLLAAATRRGRSISAVAPLPTEQLAALVASDEAALPAPQTETEAPDITGAVDAAIDRTLALDGVGLDRVLRRSLARHGLPTFVEDVIPTLMRRIGDAWHAGTLTVAQEHLASAAVIVILMESIRTLPAPPSARRILVATPAGEQHGVGAALAAASAALDGWTVVYLGVDVPADDIVSASTAADARAVVLSAVHAANAERLLSEMRSLCAAIPPSIPVIIGGAATSELGDRLTDLGAVVCRTFTDLRATLESATVSS